MPIHESTQVPKKVVFIHLLQPKAHLKPNIQKFSNMGIFRSLKLSKPESSRVLKVSNLENFRALKLSNLATESTSRGEVRGVLA